MKSKQIRALHMIHNLDHGGIENWIMEMVRHTDTECLMLDVCLTDPYQREGAHEKEFEEHYGRIIRCPFRKNIILFNKLLRKEIINGKYDIFHSHHFYASGFIIRSLRKIRNVKFVAHIHPTSDVQTGKRKAFPRPIYRWLMKKWILKYCHAILGASQASMDLNWGNRWYHDPRMFIQPNGIDLSKFNVLIQPNDMRKELRLPEKSRIILSIGRHVHHKKLLLIPEIAEIICTDHPETYFVIHGKGPMLGELKEKIERLKLTERFRLTKDFLSIIPLLKSADIFLLPSIQEGFGIVIIEAAAAGLPVVARKIPGIIEASNVCENKFLLENNSSLEAWVNAVRNALLKGRKEIANFANFEQNFPYTSKKSLDKLLKVYRLIMDMK